MSEVFERSKTQGNARLVLLSLADSCNDDASCWPSIRKIAEKANICEPITKKYLNALIQIGVITREEREDQFGRQTSNLYTINVEKIGDDEIPKSVLQQVVSPSRVKSVEGVTKVILGVGNPVQRVVGVTKVSLPIMNHNKEPKIEPSSDSAIAPSNSNESNDLFQTENKPPQKKKIKLVTDKIITELQTLNPDKDVEAETQKARTWILANPPRQLTQKFLAAWINRSTTKPERFSNF
jgi:hypothetical protein